MSDQPVKDHVTTGSLEEFDQQQVGGLLAVVVGLCQVVVGYTLAIEQNLVMFVLLAGGLTLTRVGVNVVLGRNPFGRGDDTPGVLGLVGSVLFALAVAAATVVVVT